MILARTKRNGEGEEIKRDDSCQEETFYRLHRNNNRRWTNPNVGIFISYCAASALNTGGHRHLQNNAAEYLCFSLYEPIYPMKMWNDGDANLAYPRYMFATICLNFRGRIRCAAFVISITGLF